MAGAVVTATALRASPGVDRAALIAVGAPVPAVLLVGLALRWSGALTGAIVLLGAQQATRLAIGDDVLDEWAPLVAAALLLTAELAWWSIEPRLPAWTQPRLALRRLTVVLLMCLLGAGVGAAMLVAAGSSLSGGVPLELVGILAATGAVALVAYIARRSP